MIGCRGYSDDRLYNYFKIKIIISDATGLYRLY